MAAKYLMKLARTCAATLALTTLGACTNLSQQNQKFDIGTSVPESFLSAWNIDIASDGTGLPAGGANARLGEKVYQEKCLSCHGANGAGGSANRLAGGGMLNTDKAVKTVGSFWPHATTIFDYVRRAMPHSSPQSLSDEEVYASTAYILYLNKIVGMDDVIDRTTLPAIKMPNRDGFIQVIR